MNKHHPHNDIIEKKLEQLPGADADSLWNDMRSILDKKMPQKKEKRRFIAWLLISKPFLLLFIGFIIGTGSTLYFSSRKDNTAAPGTFPGSPGLNKISEVDSEINDVDNGIAKTANRNETHTSNQERTGDTGISTTTRSVSAVADLTNDDLRSLKTKKQPAGYLANFAVDEKAQFNQDRNIIRANTQSASKTRVGFDITTIMLKSSYSNLATSYDIKEKNSLNLQTGTLSNHEKRQATNNHDRGLYSGIMSGIDLSSTNFKSVKTGSTRGFIIGYAFNKNWSLESGVLWDTKRVYDNGNHFNPPGYNPSSGITIMNVNGKSRLYELPVNIKYTIIPGEHSLFATTGLSSYFMRTENYDYEYMQNNQPIGHNYLSYKNGSKNWFSVANFSVGYTHKLGIGNLRVEPYLKVPIRRIGIGKMPIMSTGLNIGLTKHIR